MKKMIPITDRQRAAIQRIHAARQRAEQLELTYIEAICDGHDAVPQEQSAYKVVARDGKYFLEVELFTNE
jgi:hypothetical protein